MKKSILNKKHMNNIKNLFTVYKENKNTIQITKILITIVVNTWLLIIFWKILLIENVNVIGSNVALTKMQTIMQPLLMYLGLDVLSPSMIKMLIVTLIIITVNLMILNFNGMLGLIVSLGVARYGYKMYTNYLINSENMQLNSINSNILQTPKEIISQKVVEQAPIVINTGANSGTNWWLWGTVIVIGVLAIGGIALTIWSHNTNANNMLSVNENVKKVNTSLNDVNNNLNERITRNVSQIDYNNNYTTKMCNNVNTKIDLVNQKIVNLEEGFQTFGSQITKLEANNIENVKILSQNTLEISQEAKEFFGNVLESNTATEALIVSIAQLVDGFNIVTERLVTTETRLDSMTGAVTTPRSSMSFRSIIPTKLNNPTNFNE